MAIEEALLSLMGRFGYALIFLFGVGEALPVIGVVIPGHALLLASGVAASAGALDIKLVILIAFAAGVLGDAVSFWIARKWGNALFARYAHRIRIKPEHLAKSNAIFEKHGPFALVIVRFSFIARGLGPTLAGMSAMTWRTFWIYNVIGALAWAIINGLGGYAFGLSFFALQGLVGRILAYTLLGVLGILLLYRVLRRYAPDFTRGDLVVTLVGAGALTVFGIVASRLERMGGTNALDGHAAVWADALRPARPLLHIVLALGAPLAIGTISLVLVVLVGARRLGWEAVLVAFGMIGILLIAPALGEIFALTLSDDYPQGPQLPFPATPTAFLVVFAGILAYLIVERTHNPTWRFLWLGATGGLAALAVLAPLATRDTYPTGALAGLTLGLTWLSVSILVVEFGVKRRRSRGSYAEKND